MPGKLCTGQQDGNAGILENSKAFCEGVDYRAGGTAAARPITDNPHAVGSEAHDAWDRGWTVADTASPGAITPSDAPCCAVGSAAVPA